MKIITISGLDGSGKSTQIQMLKTYLESQGEKVFYFHAIEHGIATKISSLRKYCFLCCFLGKCQVKKNQSQSVTKANWITLKLRKIFLHIDIWQFKKLLNRLEKKGYTYLLSDRYFYDSVINIEYLERHKGENFSQLKISKPDIAIYLQTSPEVIMSRERKPDQGLEYLQRKKELYDKYTSLENMVIINGNRDKNQVFQDIFQFLAIKKA